MAKLPAADWTRRADLAALIAALGAGNARYVGGAVRDTLLGMPVKDVDIATLLEPPEIIARATAAGIRTIPTGIAHGTVTAVLPGGPVEITTLRRDVDTDGRHATVAFGAAWQDDAARRDFTINALYADPASGEISDFFGGLDDLAARRVRFIGDARARIAEDHLRILRYFRFQARFGSLPADGEAEAACADLAATLKGLSRERTAKEMMNLLGLPDPAPTIARMAGLGVLAVILPEADPVVTLNPPPLGEVSREARRRGRLALDSPTDPLRQPSGLPPPPEGEDLSEPDFTQGPLARLIAAETTQAVAPDPLRRLAALLPAEPALAEQVAARFRLSGAQKKRLSLAARRTDKDQDARAMAFRLGREAAIDRLLLAGQSTAPLRDWAIPVFPLKGGQIVAAGVSEGPEVARILQRIEAQWVSEGFPDAARTAALLSEALAARARC